MAKTLQLSEEITSHPSARELLRVWDNGESQTFALRVDAWEDPAAWGLLLVDIARQVAEAHAHRRGSDEVGTLRRIKAAFDAEWEFPTGTEDD